MKPPSNVKTPPQYVASLPADRAKTIATVRALVNKHIPRGYDECLVWGTIAWTIPLSRYRGLPLAIREHPACLVRGPVRLKAKPRTRILLPCNEWNAVPSDLPDSWLGFIVFSFPEPVAID